MTSVVIFQDRVRAYMDVQVCVLMRIHAWALGRWPPKGVFIRTAFMVERLGGVSRPLQ